MYSSFLQSMNCFKLWVISVLSSIVVTSLGEEGSGRPFSRLFVCPHFVVSRAEGGEWSLIVALHWDLRTVFSHVTCYAENNSASALSILNAIQFKVTMVLFSDWCTIQPYIIIWATSRQNLFIPFENNKDADQPAQPRSLISAPLLFAK